MDSGDGTSSESSASDVKPRPVGGAEEDGMVYCPPHFSQRGRSHSGSNFSPHSEETSEEDSSSSGEDRGHPVAPPIPIRTYAPPPMINNTSDCESESDMEPGQTAGSRHVSVPYQPAPVRNRQVNYKQFYGSERAGSNNSGPDSSESEEEVGWKRGKKKKVSFN